MIPRPVDQVYAAGVDVSAVRAVVRWVRDKDLEGSTPGNQYHLSKHREARAFGPKRNPPTCRGNTKTPVRTY